MNNNWLKMAGQAILMASSSASGAPYILIQTNSKGEVNPSYGGGASGAYVSPGYPYSALPGVASGTTDPTVGAMLYCTDCYSSGNAAKTLRIPVWWNGSVWTDALGQQVQH
ncbi:hypothetical protein AA3990_1489 [Gluconobacter roseus NBRC 3990]|nr:hypothetical protein AA3990_1489 [Gluconobacter roseus NBRC 3990]